MIELTSTHRDNIGEISITPTFVSEVIPTGNFSCGNTQCAGCECLVIIHNSREWHIKEDYEYVKFEIYKYEERYLS